MENWTPADVGEAYAQKQVQYESDAAAVQRNATNTPGADGSITTVDSSGLNAWLLAALAVGGISLFIATRNRK
jgi:hypothetical protein